MVVSHKTFNIDFKYGIENIEHVDSFPYLGIMINFEGNSTDSTQRLCNNSLRALHKLLRTTSKTNMRAKYILHIYDHTIKKQILLCGSEATNVFNPTRKNASAFEDFTCKSILEKPHKNVMRRIEGVKNKTSVDALNSEFGRYPIYINILGRMLDYENGLTLSDPCKLIFHAYIENKSLADKGKPSWVSCIKHIKNQLNLNNTGY